MPNLPLVSCLFTNEVSGCKGEYKVRPVIGATCESIIGAHVGRFLVFTFSNVVDLPFLRACRGFLFPRECFSTGFPS